MALNKDERTAIIQEHRTHDGDSGSPEALDELAFIPSGNACLNTDRPEVNITSHSNGESVPYGGVYLGADIADPEKSGPWGNEFSVSVAFSSDVDGPLCSDSGVVSPYGCETPTLSTGSHTITATATDPTVAGPGSRALRT